MKFWVRIGMLVVVLAFVTLEICAGQSSQEQSPQEQSPSQGQQPTEPAPSTSPDAAQPDTKPQTQAPSENQTTSPQTPAPATPEAAVLKRRPVHKKKTTKPQSGKVVVRNGGAKEGSPQLAPGTSKEQELHKRANTNQLLATTDANLKSVAGRQLSSAQQSMMEQIRTYMSQSKAAADSGDLDRAHTLAYKAHLLSDELAKK